MSLYTQPTPPSLTDIITQLLLLLLLVLLVLLLLQLAEQLLDAYEVVATLINATPAFAETEATEPHLWERVSPSLLLLLLLLPSLLVPI